MEEADVRLAGNPYDRLAPVYDAYKCVENYSRAATLILELAAAMGVHPKTALDAATGTGNLAFEFSRRGISVAAFDISEQMPEKAAEKNCDQRIEFFRADICELEPLPCRVDLVTCWNDSLNCITSPDLLKRAFRATKPCMTENSLLVFDMNTLSIYESMNRGLVTCETLVGPITLIPTASKGWSSATIEFFWNPSDETSGVPSGVAHVQRHCSPSEVTALLEASGYEVVAFRGISNGNFIATNKALKLEQGRWVSCGLGMRDRFHHMTTRLHEEVLIRAMDAWLISDQSEKTPDES